MLRRYNALETRASARPLRLIVATSARALLEDKKGDFDHLSPKAVVIAGVKAAALQGVLAVTLKLNEKVAEMQEQINRGDEPTAMDDFDPINDTDWTGYPRKVLINFVKSVSIVSSHRGLENLCLLRYTEAFVDKLVTDTSKYATRQYSALGGRLSMLGKSHMFFWTGVNACMLNHMAIFFVEHTTYTIRVLNHKRLALRDPNRQPKQRENVAAYVEKTAENAAKCLCSVVASGIGATAGTMIWPGMGTAIGAMVGDTVMYLVEFPSSG